MATQAINVVVGGDSVSVGTPLPPGTQGTGIRLQDYSQQAVVTNWSGAVTVNVDNGNRFYATLTGNVTGVTLSGFPASGEEGQANLHLIQGSGAPYTVTWPNTIKWVGGVAPTLGTTAADIDIVALTTVDGGATFIGYYVGRAS